MKTSPEYLDGHYFLMPNSVFDLELSTKAIAVYAYLMRLENRKTHLCWAKQETIGAAVGIKSPTTVRGALTELEEKGLIYRDDGTMNLNGKVVNGIQRFTIRPIDDAILNWQYEQIEKLTHAADEQKKLTLIENYNTQHPDDPIRFRAT